MERTSDGLPRSGRSCVPARTIRCVPPSGAIWDFFIAHAGADTTAAEELYDYLSEAANTYLDSRSLRLGDDWDVALRNAQERARVTVVLISENSDAAYYQREEIAAAIARAREDPEAHRVVPVYLDGFPSAGNGAPYGLRIKHGLALSQAVTLRDAAQKLIALLFDLRAEAASARTLWSDSQATSPTLRYELEVRLCIDSSIPPPAVSRVLMEASSAPMSIANAMLKLGKPVVAIRVAVVGDADYGGPVDDWLNLPGDSSEMFAALRRALAPSNEAPETAMARQFERALGPGWSKPAGVVRQVTWVWSGSDIEIDEERFDALHAMWAGESSTLAPSGKRLVIFAPATPAWETIANGFEYAIHFQSLAGEDLSASDADEILNLVSASV